MARAYIPQHRPAITGEITSETEGCVKWNIANFREVWENCRETKVFCYSPYFTYSGVKFYLQFHIADSYSSAWIQLYSNDLKGAYEYFLEFQLLTVCNIVSDLKECILRTEDEAAGVRLNLTEFLSKESRTPLHDHLQVLLRVRHLTGILLHDEFKSITKLLKDLKSLLASGENSDVTLVVGGAEFPVHRNILCARSPVFKAMLCHDTTERESGTVNIEDCDSDSFLDFLTYVYTGSTRHIDTENVISLYTTSDKYLMQELKEACVCFMKENMSVEGFCNIAILALRHDEKDLVEVATKFFCDNAKEITKTENWVTFLEENSNEANEHFIKPLTRRF